VIQGYTRYPSVRPGETLTLHVSTDHPHFRVEIYRQGARLEPMGRLGPDRLPGHAAPSGPPDRDWGWPAYAFSIPAGWSSGVYIAMLVGLDAAGRAHTRPMWPRQTAPTPRRCSSCGVRRRAGRAPSCSSSPGRPITRTTARGTGVSTRRRSGLAARTRRASRWPRDDPVLDHLRLRAVPILGPLPVW